MLEVIEYLDQTNNSPFAKWFDKLEPGAAVRVVSAMTRIGQGKLSNVKPVGRGREVFEFVIDYGPGYRVYFGRDGDRLVILLAGGNKKTQQRDIDTAHERWADYKQRKR